ncbi:MAG: hypothetical protein RR853_07865 [Aurantimicrobium sp.]|uniref:hypothetical protein n=1 Tax=Aurantimicrobium sp. TaxID=1930784 RepID=UPI002FC616F9
MTDNSESTFQPHSDEELARLLEEQMRAMRSSAPITAPQPTVSAVPVEPVVAAEVEEELGIDELFGALLEDTTDIPVVQVEEEVVFIPSVDESSLEHTQPITYIQEDVVEVAVIDEQIVVEETITEAAIIDNHIVVEETVVEEVIEDAHVIAERILSEISIDGEIVATTISATAGADPIPLMFGEAAASAPIAAPVFAASMSYTPEPVVIEGDIIVDEVVLEGNTEEEVAVEAVVVDEVVVEEFEAPVFRSTNPINHINSFAPRPTFDELVFGVKSDD